MELRKSYDMVSGGNLLLRHRESDIESAANSAFDQGQSGTSCVVNGVCG